MQKINKVTPQQKEALESVLKEEGAEAVVRYVIATNPPVPVSTTEASEWLIQLGILKKNPFEKEKKVKEEKTKKTKEKEEEEKTSDSDVEEDKLEVLEPKKDKKK